MSYFYRSLRTTMNRLKLTLLFVITTVLLYGQSNPEYMELDVKSDSLYKIELFSLGTTPQNINIPSIAYDSLSIEPIGDNLYELHIQFADGEIGETDLDIEYSAIGDIPGIPYPFFSTLQFRVYNSEVTAEDDIVVVDEGGYTIVTPLGNDESSDGPVALEHIAYTQNCTAAILTDFSIEVNVVDPSENAYISYVVADTLGTTESGKIVLISESQGEDLNLSLHNKSSIDIYLSSDYAVDTAPSNGTVDEVLQNCWRYTPDEDFVGDDSIVFNNDGQSVTITTEVFDESLNVQFVKDDQAYVAPGGTVTFNVLDNDLLDFLPIIDYSTELDYLGGGEFQYDASDPNFSGDLVFHYTIFNGFLFINGEIVIHVDHFSPNVFGVDYVLQTSSQNPLSIVHHTPLEDFSITVVTPPSFGTVTIVDDVYIGECDSTSILNSIIYDPNGVAGNDLFEIEYCTTDDHCEIVRIDIISIDDGGADCACLEDCIWDGDVNQDGIVNSEDIMELAFNVGETGESRTTNGLWTAQESQDWQYHQAGSDRDLSHSDTNGDGFIDNDDFAVVEENYGLIHDLLPVQAYNLLSSPVNLIPNQSDVDSGDLVIFYIEIGDDENPIKNFSGLSFNFNIDASLIDSSSVYVDFYEDSWAGYGNATKVYYNQTTAGNIDVAFSHVGQASNTGAGLIGEVGFIVEDEIGGLRLDDLFINLDIHFSRGVMLDGGGTKYSLPEGFGRTRVAVSIDPDGTDLSDLDEINIVVGPNPASNLVNISAELEVIDAIEIQSITGVKYADQDYTQPIQSTNIDIVDLPSGTYIVTVYAQGQIKSEKLIKL